MRTNALDAVRWVNENLDEDRFFSEIVHLEKMQSNDYEIRGVCPVHQEADNPTSFRYSKKTKTYSCYSHHCEEKYGRSVIGLVKGLNNCNGFAAFTLLKDFIGKEFSGDAPVDRQSKNEQMWEANLKFLSQNEDKKISYISEGINNEYIENYHPYFLTRGYSALTLKYFGVGYADDGQLAGRLTIPVRDENNNLVMIAGRDPMYRDGDPNGKKYKNWWGSDKTSILYNLNNVKLQGTSEIWIVEGYCCVWRAFDFGLRNVVACMGNALSKKQIKLLLSYATDVVVALDNDAAGEQGKQSLIERIGDLVNLYEVEMKYKDLADYNDPVEFQQLIESKKRIN